MATELEKTRVKVPDWVQSVLTRYENLAEAHNEVQISDALSAARKGREDLNDEDWKGFISETSAFLFMERPAEDSVWETYFAPMFTATRNDNTEVRSPDVKDLDADVVAHWGNRAKSVQNPVMRARYADLVWDLERVIAKGQRRQHEYAQIAIDAYLEAIDKARYPMDIEGVGWLRRALDLSLSIGDKERQKRVVDSIFVFYDKVVDPRHAGVWIFPFDALYDKKGLLSPEQEARVIANLETMLARTSAKGKEFDPFGAQAAAERLARHYKRHSDQANVERVIKTYGQAFEKISEEASPMLAMAWLQPVVERYEQEGLKSDAEQLQNLSAEKGKNIASDLKWYEVKVEVKPEEVDELVEHLIGSGDLKTALARVADYYIPKANDARKLLEQVRTDAPLLSLIPISIIEPDGHTSARIGSVEEDKEGRLHKQLGETVGFYQPFLAHTLIKLREQYAPTVEDVLDFLCQSPLFANSRDGLLRDGLIAYEQEDFVKAIQVLVPQIEQILRNFLGYLGIPTLKTVRNHPGVMDAKSMNEVLGDERMQNALTENLWRYLAVVYTDKRGMNLRNNLAHGLVGRNGFNRFVADRVFHTLLALGLMRPKT